MRPRLLKYWDQVRTSLWFVPALMLAGSAALALSALAIDARSTNGWLSQQSWGYTGSAEGARAVLGTIAGSMITIAGVVFSLTLVALTLASSQFGPRLLRNFMHDATNQVVLGTFIATFLYCLLVLRAIRGEEDAFVPQLAVSLGVLLALASVGVLIHFIHHVAVSIQVDEVVTRVASELAHGIDQIFPEQIGEGPDESESDEELSLPPEEEAQLVCASEDGYVQLVDADQLMELAARHDLLVRLQRRPGHYVAEGTPLALAWPAGSVGPELAAAIERAFVTGTRRTPVQDVEFCIVQLVEIALRALSPGVNEPFTAIACVDQLGAALARLARRRMPHSQRRDEHGTVRVVAHAPTFPAVVDAAFDPIRQSARESAAVSIRLLEAILMIAREVRRPPDREVLLRQAGMIARGAHETLPEPNDRHDVQVRYEKVRQRLEGGGTEA